MVTLKVIRNRPSPVRDQPTPNRTAKTGALSVLICVCLAGICWYNNRLPRITVPTHALPTNNAFDDWVKAGKMLTKTKSIGPIYLGSWGTDYTFADLQASYQESRPALEVFRRGLRKPYLHPAVRSFDITSPYFTANREIARLLSAEALYYQCTGQYGKAVDARLDGMEFGAVQSKGAPMTGGLSGNACMTISRLHFEDLIPRLSRAELAKTAQRLETIESRIVPLSEVIREEGYRSAASLRASMERERNPIKLFTTLSGGGSDWWETTWLSVQLAFTNKQKMLDSQADYFNNMANDAQKPYVSLSAGPLPDGPLADLIYPEFTRSRRLFETQNAIVYILQMEVALRRYFLDNLCYPTKLSELVPKYMQTISPDPFGNKPFVYRLISPNKYLLYSLGRNFRDDGGIGGRMRRNSDIVAGSLERSRVPALMIKGAPVPTALQ